MRLRAIGARRLGAAPRCLALLTLALFGHAVALNLLHCHGVAADVGTQSRAESISKPSDTPAGQTRSHDDCQACQLQHGFTFLGAAPTSLWHDGCAPIGHELASVSAAPRLAEGSAPSRAPPTL